MPKLLDVVNQYWREVTFIAAVVSGALYFFSVQSDASDAIKKTTALEKSFAQQVQINERLAGQLDVVLRVLLPKASDSVLNKWSKYPTVPPFDSIGKPVCGNVWLSVSWDYRYGELKKFVLVDDSVIECQVSVEWDVRPKE